MITERADCCCLRLMLADDLVACMACDVLYAPFFQSFSAPIGYTPFSEFILSRWRGGCSLRSVQRADRPCPFSLTPAFLSLLVFEQHW